MYHICLPWAWIPLQPEMEVVISVQESLLEGTQIDQGNLMTLTVETLYSPPESWTMTGTQYAYASALPIPTSADVRYINA